MFAWPIRLMLLVHCRPVLLQSGVEKLAQLRVLFLSNNKVRDWTEVDRLAALERLEELLLVGNPLYNDHKDNNTLPDYRVEVSTWGPRRLTSADAGFW